MPTTLTSIPGRIDPAPARMAPAPPEPVISHGLAKSLALHLGPGVAMLLFYLASAPSLMRLGYPPLFASLLTIPFILVPWMLGYLAWEAKRTTGRFDWSAVIAFREVLPRWQYVAFAIPLILWGAFVFQLSERLLGQEFLRGALDWMPAWFLNPQDFEQIVAMPAAKLAIFLGALLLFAGVVAPVVEELYFRGHLLPGLARYGLWAPLLNTALFTIYHLESPWEGPGRFLMVLPLFYLVWWKRSVRLGIWIHVALNTISALALIAAVLAAR